MSLGSWSTRSYICQEKHKKSEDWKLVGGCPSLCVVEIRLEKLCCKLDLRVCWSQNGRCIGAACWEGLLIERILFKQVLSEMSKIVTCSLPDVGEDVLRGLLCF